MSKVLEFYEPGTRTWPREWLSGEPTEERPVMRSLVTTDARTEDEETLDAYVKNMRCRAPHPTEAESIDRLLAVLRAADTHMRCSVCGLRYDDDAPENDRCRCDFRQLHLSPAAPPRVWARTPGRPLDVTNVPRATREIQLFPAPKVWREGATDI